jgi:hypothetical protein
LSPPAALTTKEPADNPAGHFSGAHFGIYHFSKEADGFWRCKFFRSHRWHPRELFGQSSCVPMQTFQTYFGRDRTSASFFNQFFFAFLDLQEIPLRTAQIYVPLQYPPDCADNPKGRAKGGHDYSRGEASTRLKEILEVEPRLPAKARAAQPPSFALRDPRSARSVDGNVGIFRGTRQGNHSGG